MIRAASLLLTCSVVALCARADDSAGKKDQDKLQGAWKIVKAIKDGEAIPAAELETQELLVKGNQMTFKAPQGNEVVTFMLDPSAKPQTIDFTAPKKQSIPGIYKLEGDTLTLCFRPESKHRPKEFESKKKSDVRLMVLERKKK